jgi:hypothetical protein
MSQPNDLRSQPKQMVQPRKSGRRSGKQAEFDRKLNEALDAGEHVHVASHRGIRCVSRHCQFPQMDG